MNKRTHKHTNTQTHEHMNKQTHEHTNKPTHEHVKTCKCWKKEDQKIVASAFMRNSCVCVCPRARQSNVHVHSWNHLHGARARGRVPRSVRWRRRIRAERRRRGGEEGNMTGRIQNERALRKSETAGRSIQRSSPWQPLPGEYG